MDPSGNTYYYWSAIVMLCVLYNLLIIIVRAVFQTPNQGWVKQMWYPLDYLSDFVYLCDMFAKSRIGMLLLRIVCTILSFRKLLQINRITVNYLHFALISIDILFKISKISTGLKPQWNNSL